jgi:dTDP-4-amino-4,6-dideoxygalactose transaminase
MGLTNLESLHDFIRVNLRHYGRYHEELDGIKGVKLLSYDAREAHNYQYIVLEIDESETGISRDQLMKILHAENILARRYFYPGCHRMQPYRSYFPNAGLLLPETEKLTQRVLCLPTGTGVSEEQIGIVCQIVRSVLDHSVEISRRMSPT